MHGIFSLYGTLTLGVYLLPELTNQCCKLLLYPLSPLCLLGILTIELTGVILSLAPAPFSAPYRCQEGARGVHCMAHAQYSVHRNQKTSISKKQQFLADQTLHVSSETYFLAVFYLVLLYFFLRGKKGDLPLLVYLM